MKLLVQIEWHEREEDVPPPDNVIEDMLAINSEAEDGCDLQDILASGTLDVRSSLSSYFLIIQKSCCLHCMDRSLKLGRLSSSAKKA